MIRQRAFGSAAPAGTSQIVICRLNSLAHFRDRLRMIAFQTLHVVEHAQTALLAESFELIGSLRLSCPTRGM